MAMSVTGIRRPGSMIVCRRASRVSALGRTSWAASAGSPAGIASHQNTYSSEADARDGGEHDEREPHQPDRQVEMGGEPERDATEPAARARVGAAAAGGARRGSERGARSDRHMLRAAPGVGVRGPFRGAAHQVQGGVRGPPDAAGPSGRSGSRHGHEHSHRRCRTRPGTGQPRAGPDTGAGRPRRTASSPPCGASASPGPTTAGSAASAAASVTGSASTRSWCAASSSRRCCSAGSGSSRTAWPGPCCPSAATVASTSRR